MNYNRFKYEMVNKFPEYLPQEYQSWKLEMKTINKVNETLEAFSLVNKTERSASPTLYFRDFYELYKTGMSVEGAAGAAVKEFLRGIKYVEGMQAEFALDDAEHRLICQLISTERNQHLLCEVPHRDFLDLSLIYRYMIKSSEEGFESVIITDRLAAKMEMNEEELYRTAMRNMPKVLEKEITLVDRLFYLVTNKLRCLGAAAVLYPGALEEIAERTGSDLYILPSSIHEVFIIKAGFHSVRDLENTVLHANLTVVRSADILSDSVYLYKREKGEIEIAEDGAFC